MSTADGRARGARLPSVAVLLVRAVLRVRARFICVLCRFKKPSGAQRRYSSASHDSSLVTIQTERDKKKASLTSTRVAGRCDDRRPPRRCQRTKLEAGNGAKLNLPGRTRLIAAFQRDVRWRLCCCAAGDKVGAWRGTKFPSGAATFLCFSAGLRWFQRPDSTSEAEFCQVDRGDLDSFDLRRWWTTNLSFRTDLPPTTPSLAPTSTARNSPAMALYPRPPRRPTRTPTLRVSQAV